jgi:quinol monooxygenase YgiN
MSNLRWNLIRISLAVMGLSVLSVGVAESSGPVLRHSDRGAMDARSTRCVEDDFVTVTGAAGPGLAATQGALAQAEWDGHVASTAAVLQLPDASARERALDVLKADMKRQKKAPGFTSAALGTSEKCGSVRLVSVWHDEASMLNATASSAFIAAMGKAESAGGTGMVTAWKVPVSEIPVGLDVAREKLAGTSPL